MGRVCCTRWRAGVARPINLILTTFAVLLVTAAVAAEARITDVLHAEGCTDLQTIKSLNLLIQRAYLSEPGSGTTCTLHWAGQPAEIRGYGNRSTVTFPTKIDPDQGALGLQDPGSIIRSFHSNGTHMTVEYNVGMNNLTVPAGDLVLVIIRTHDGVRLELGL
ncbi:MAG: hypothetical protein ACQXXL_00715 [Candidatus Methanosuratincola sp.]|nr:hypothetical protein [Candidatus Methanosuratincola sp.]